MSTIQPGFKCSENRFKFSLSTFCFMIVLLAGFCYSVVGQQNWIRNHIIFTNGPGDIKAADMNADSLVDVVATIYHGNLLIWYSNPSWSANLIGSLTDPIHLKVDDLDRDGDLDVVASSQGPEAVVWFENDPSAPLGWDKHIIDNSLLITGPFGVECVGLVDLSGDDTLDVVAAGSQIVWFEWPHWTPHVIDAEPGGSSRGCSYFCIGDINGDTNPDLIAGNWTDSISVFPGNLVWYDLMNGTKDTIALDQGVCYGIDIGDIDNDGDTDIITGSWGRNYLRWYENQDTVWEPITIDPVLTRASRTFLVDIDNDSDLDIFTAGDFTPGWVGWHQNNLPDDWGKMKIGAMQRPWSLAPGDIDGNSYMDLVVSGLVADSIVWFKNPFTSITSDSKIIASEPFLYQNYPNPFNPITFIDFYLPKTTEISLQVFNLLGEAVASLHTGQLPAGSYSYEWDASNFASGVYLYRLQAGNYVETRKMVLMR